VGDCLNWHAEQQKHEKFTQSNFDIVFLPKLFSDFYKGNCGQNEQIYTYLKVYVFFQVCRYGTATQHISAVKDMQGCGCWEPRRGTSRCLLKKHVRAGFPSLEPITDKQWV
jgi:hypothetical protein